LVNDSPEKNTEGNANNNSFAELKPLLSPGNSKLKQRNAAGIIVAVVKLILPQNNFHERSLNKYAIRMLNIQPAEAHARIENAKFTRLKVDLFKKTKKPNPIFTKNVTKSNNSMRIKANPEIRYSCYAGYFPTINTVCLPPNPCAFIPAILTSIFIERFGT
jgi:hypothetical protein